MILFLYITLYFQLIFSHCKTFLPLFPTFSFHCKIGPDWKMREIQIWRVRSDPDLTRRAVCCRLALCTQSVVVTNSCPILLDKFVQEPPYKINHEWETHTFELVTLVFTWARRIPFPWSSSQRSPWCELLRNVPQDGCHPCSCQPGGVLPAPRPFRYQPIV